MQYWFYYLMVINIVGFFVMIFDKQKSKGKGRRISEKTLLAIAGIGGSVGTYLAMQLFRHKTKHTVFFVGVPMMMMTQALLIVLLQRAI